MYAEGQRGIADISEVFHLKGTFFTWIPCGYVCVCACVCNHVCNCVCNCVCDCVCDRETEGQIQLVLQVSACLYN